MSFFQESKMAKVIVLVEELYEDLELWYPKLRLEEASHQVIVAGPLASHIYNGKHGYPCKAEMSFKEALLVPAAAVVIPGGYAPDRIRRFPEALQIVQKSFSEGKIIAFICHGGWVPISAKIVKGKKVTSFIAIKDDLENAGALWQDNQVVVDGNLISSRHPADLPFFAKAIVDLM
jgi:protease I